MTGIRKLRKGIAHQPPPPCQRRGFTLPAASLSLRLGSHKIRDEPHATRSE
jgi:hypothetical protein